MSVIQTDHSEYLFDRASLMLHDGVKQRLHPFHYLSLATIGLDGIPKSRTVILRRYDPFHRHVTFHSDIRSPKIQEIQRAPFVSLLFYSQPDRLQVRLTAKASVHHLNEVAYARWEQTITMSKLTYLTDYAPSTLFPNEEALLQRPTQLSRKEDELAFQNFSVVQCDFYEMDITELRSDGNLRVRLRWDTRNQILSERLTP
jgi:pyridoxamine 5'-phosphate oxidase